MRFVAAMALWLVASSAFAVPVTYVFSGYIDQSTIGGPNDGPYEGLVPPDLGVEVGMTFNGLLNYDSDVLSCNPVTETGQVCGGAEATAFWMVTFGNFVLTSTNPHIYVADDYMSFQQGGQFLPSIYDGWSLLAQSDTYLYLLDGPTSLLESSSAPSDLSLFQQGHWIENAFIRPASWTTDGLRWNVGGTITEFHRVPEPATAALFGVGLLMVAVSTRRRKAVHRVD